MKDKIYPVMRSALVVCPLSIAPLPVLQADEEANKTYLYMTYNG